MKDIEEMSVEELRLEKNELMPMVLITKELGLERIFDYKGLDYWDSERRYFKICDKLLVMEILKKI